MLKFIILELLNAHRQLIFFSCCIQKIMIQQFPANNGLLNKETRAFRKDFNTCSTPFTVVVGVYCE